MPMRLLSRKETFIFRNYTEKGKAEKGKASTYKRNDQRRPIENKSDNQQQSYSHNYRKKIRISLTVIINITEITIETAIHVSDEIMLTLIRE